jgi:hypothetical protein
MQPTTKIFKVPGADGDLTELLVDELPKGWKLVSRTYDPTKYRGRGEITLEFEAVPVEPEEPDEYDDQFEGQQYFEYDGDAKSTWWHGQQIS